MLSHEELVALERSLRGTHVLSLYVGGTAADPAEQHAWRLQLDHALGDLRADLADASHEERELFDRCIRLQEVALGTAGTRAGAPGWVAFITPDGVRYSGPVPAPMPTLATWSPNACVAPYLRALKETRPVIVAVMDARKATVYRYHGGELHDVTTLRAHHEVPPPAHMGDIPRAGFHNGTRGPTGRDAAQRARLAGRNRMLGDLAGRVAALAGEDGLILLGGIPRVVAHATKLLSPLKDRIRALDSLDVHSTPAEITAAARAGASAARNAFDEHEVQEIVEQAEAGSLGVLGPTATERALELSTVRTLLLSERFLHEHAETAAEVVRRAFQQDAEVEELSGPAAERLDALGGIAARLRFRPSDAGLSPPS